MYLYRVIAVGVNGYDNFDLRTTNSTLQQKHDMNLKKDCSSRISTERDEPSDGDQVEEAAV